MIPFKQFFYEMSGHEEFTRIINQVPEHKRNDFRKTYSQLRKKGVLGRAAMTQAWNLHREDWELGDIEQFLND